MPEKHIGKVVQVMGPVLDIRFKDGELPALLNAIEVENNGKKLIVEVAQHVGDNVVRCIAMAATDGLVRGADAVDTGEPIKVPVGDECLGRVFNLLGEPVDEQPAPENTERWPIHRQAPAFDEQESATEILETGIKVVDLILPLCQGRQNRSVRRCRCRQNRSDPGIDLQHRDGPQRLFCLYRRRRAHPRGQRPVR